MRSSGAKLAIERDGKDLVMVLSLSRRWLTDERRAFPVRLDPSISIGVGEPRVQRQLRQLPRLPVLRPEDRHERDRGVADRGAVQTSRRPAGRDDHGRTAGDAVRRHLPLAGMHVHGAHVQRLPAPVRLEPELDQLRRQVLRHRAARLRHAPRRRHAARLDWTITVLVRAWHTGARPNHGLIVKRSTEPATPTGSSRWSTRCGRP